MSDPVPKQIGEVPFFRSGLLDRVEGLAHAFPCKIGSPTDSIDKLTGRLAGAFGMDGFFLVNQVHGVDAIAFDGNPTEARKHRDTNADAVVTRTRGLAAGVRTADCVPILIADPINRVVAAVHGGWRGTVDGVIGAAVKKMNEVYTSRPRDIIASTGPHIMSCCYEVGPEVASRFENRFGNSVIKPGKGDRSFLDLSNAVKSSLLDAGVQEQNIDIPDLCTCCKEKLFYSYRRDGKGTGRQLSFILFK